MNFAQILKSVPSIHVCKPFGAVKILTPQDHDEKYKDRQYSTDYTEGNGTEENPLTYLSAAPVSPHYAIIDLWCRCRKLSGTCFIKVNDWILRVDAEGVTAVDGHFTKFI